METKLKIGLEIHLRLNIKRRLFSDSKVKIDDEINSFKNKIGNYYISDIDIAVPGTLPLLNKKAVLLGIRTTKILNGELADNLEFDRKNYFYHDMPKGYQITQFYKPIGKNGFFNFISSDDKLKKIEIESMALEEDTAATYKTKEGLKVDFDRAGTALLEITTKPNFTCSEDVKFFLISIIYLLKRFKISNCWFGTGSIRVDVNISTLSLDGTKKIKRIEVKNVGNIKNIVNAIKLEYQNQIEILNKGLENKSKIQTKHYDEKIKKLFIMREKMSETEYLFIPETNIPSIEIKKEWIESQNKFIKDIKIFSEKDLIKKYNINFEEKIILIKYPYIFNFFLKIIEEKIDSKIVLNFLKSSFVSLSPTIIDKNDFKDKTLKFYLEKYKRGELAKKIFSESEYFETLKRILNLIKLKIINFKDAKNILNKLFDKFDIEIIDNYLNNLKKINNFFSIKDIEKFLKEIIDSDSKILNKYKEQPKHTQKYIMGQIMKWSKGKINASLVIKIVKKYFEKLIIK